MHPKAELLFTTYKPSSPSSSSLPPVSLLPSLPPSLTPRLV